MNKEQQLLHNTCPLFRSTTQNFPNTYLHEVNENHQQEHFISFFGLFVHFYELRHNNLAGNKKTSEFIVYNCYDKSGKFLVKKVVEMSFLRLPFLNVYILVVILTIIAGDHTYYQETSRKGRSVYFENATLQQYGEQTAEVSLPNYPSLDVCCICFLVG